MAIGCERRAFAHVELGNNTEGRWRGSVFDRAAPIFVDGHLNVEGMRMQGSIYTFVLNFEGETYVSQVESGSLRRAMLIWGESLDVNAVKLMREDIRRGFLEDIQDGEYGAPINGLVNAWMFVVESQRRFGHVYVAKAENSKVGESIEAGKSRYTFFMNFEGGEYASQVYASSVHNAVLEWGRSLAVDQIEHLDRKLKAVFQAKIRNIYPNKIRDLDGAWSFSVAPAGRIALVTIIRTSDEQEKFIEMVDRAYIEKQWER